MKFIDPKTDFAFKRIFGSEDSKKTLISFINASLELEGSKQVKSVEIKNPYQTPELPIMKESIVDVSCTDGLGVNYLVEMQMAKVKGFTNRLIHNLTKCHASLPDKGSRYPDMNDVVLIAVMDFTLFEKFEPFHSIYILKEVKTDYAPFNQLKVCCLELTKFHKKEEELTGMLDKWCYFLKETPNLKIRPEVLKEDVFGSALEKAETANLTREELEIYDVYWQKIRDQRGLLDQAHDDGRSEGKVEGRAEGRAEGRKEGLVEGIEKTALKMLKDGLDIETIKKYTGLSLKRIKYLKSRM